MRCKSTHICRGCVDGMLLNSLRGLRPLISNSRSKAHAPPRHKTKAIWLLLHGLLRWPFHVWSSPEEGRVTGTSGVRGESGWNWCWHTGSGDESARHTEQIGAHSAERACARTMLIAPSSSSFCAAEQSTWPTPLCGCIAKDKVTAKARQRRETESTDETKKKKKRSRKPG